MILSCLVQNLFIDQKYNFVIEKYITWIGFLTGYLFLDILGCTRFFKDEKRSK